MGPGTNAVLGWLFGPGQLDLGGFPSLAGLDLTNLTSPATQNALGAVGQWVATQFFGLTWDNIQAAVVQAAGAGNVAVAAQALNAVQLLLNSPDPGKSLVDWLQANGGFSGQDLAEQALSAAAQAAARRVVPPVVAEVTVAFATLGAGKAVTALYNGVSWLADNLNKLGNLATLLAKIAGQVDAVGTGQAGAGDALAKDITDLLNKSVPLVLSFAAAQVPGLSGLPGAIRDTVQKVQGYPLGKVQQAATTVVGKARGLLGANGGPTDLNGLVGPVVAFRVGSVTHHVWVVNQNGQPAILVASNKHQLSLFDDPIAGKQPEATAAAQKLTQDTQKGIADAKLGPAAAAALVTDVKAVASDEQALDQNLAPGAKVNAFFAKVPIPASSLSDINPNDGAAFLQSIPSYRGRGVQGVLVINGVAYRLSSDGSTEPGYTNKLASPLRPVGVVDGFTPDTTTHVEGSVVAVIRCLLYRGALVNDATLYENLAPCGAKETDPERLQRCDYNLAKMLPKGFTLHVVWKTPDGVQDAKSYDGKGLS